MSTAGDQVSWQELAGVVDALDLQPGYSNAAGRAFVTLADGALLWAEVGVVRLDPEVVGASRLQAARLDALARKSAAEHETWLAGLSDDARERFLAERLRVAAMPDPPQHVIDAAEARRVQ